MSYVLYMASYYPMFIIFSRQCPLQNKRPIVLCSCLYIYAKDSQPPPPALRFSGEDKLLLQYNYILLLFWDIGITFDILHRISC